MRDRSRKRRPADLNSLAASIVTDATDEDAPEPADDGKDPAAVALGRRGGLVGGERVPTSSRRSSGRSLRGGRRKHAGDHATRK